MVSFILLVFATDIVGENFKIFSEPDNRDIFSYDKDSVKTSSGKVKVVVKLLYSEEKKVALIEIYKKFPDPPKNVENLSFNISLKEIDCKEGKYRTLTNTDYDKYGNIISINYQSGEYDSIDTASAIGTLRKIVCK